MYNVYAQELNGKIVDMNAGYYEITSPGWHHIYSGTPEEMPDLSPKGIMTAHGGFNYAIINGEIVERSAQDIAADEKAANPA